MDTLRPAASPNTLPVPLLVHHSAPAELPPPKHAPPPPPPLLHQPLPAPIPRYSSTADNEESNSSPKKSASSQNWTRFVPSSWLTCLPSTRPSVYPSPFTWTSREGEPVPASMHTCLCTAPTGPSPPLDLRHPSLPISPPPIRPDHHTRRCWLKPACIPGTNLPITRPIPALAIAYYLLNCPNIRQTKPNVIPSHAVGTGERVCFDAIMPRGGNMSTFRIDCS
ncbi:unnamed protein product [Periconia digitata]|uniref:Uncharacterized protein n=1 Tax=Periconia digitata TaxID=1303443 RepID=A0A9W4USW4_9PLEO|nr:unnamed protein product [Periconia digitata]